MLRSVSLPEESSSSSSSNGKKKPTSKSNKAAKSSSSGGNSLEALAAKFCPPNLHVDKNSVDSKVR
jgi:hypothetical protein